MRGKRPRTDEIGARGQRVYRRLRSELERKYRGIAFTIDWKAGEVAAIAHTLVEVAHEAKRQRPGKSFYIRKIGEEIFVLNVLASIV